MGRLLDGVWRTDDLGADDEGRFVRRETQFRALVTTDAAAPFPAEAGRYHLYVCWACPWSHRVLIFRHLRGLEGIVSASFADPVMGADGWVLPPGADSVLGKTKLYEVYLASLAEYTGRASIPVLFDTSTRTIVSNDSNDITLSLDSAFGAWSTGDSLFSTGAEATAIRAMIDANYDPLQNGVYKCGFAASQSAYDDAARALFDRLDVLEELLGKRRYLMGDTITAADWYLFPTLYRFDAIYYVHFKCSRNQLREMKNLWGYARSLFQQPGIAETCNMEETRRHYYLSHESIHPRGYIPLGPLPDFTTPHGR